MTDEVILSMVTCSVDVQMVRVMMESPRTMTGLAGGTRGDWGGERWWEEASRTMKGGTLVRAAERSRVQSREGASEAHYVSCYKHGRN